MAFTAKGPSGEVRVGGRKAATLGRWELKSAGNRAFICEAQALETDAYLLEFPNRELRLHAGSKVYVWKHVEVGGGGDQLTISGTGSMTLLDR